MTSRRLAPAVSVLAATILLAGPPIAARNDNNATEMLGLLHDGRFDEAEARSRAAAQGGDPGALFQDAFVYYWRVLYDDENPALQAAFDQRLTRVIEAADRRLRDRPRDPEAALWGGTAHLLRGQLLGRQKKVYGAGMEAKRARRLLEIAATGPRAVRADAAFGLGSYDYLADQLKGAARGLRAVLGIPGGNRAEGLRQLERAARESPHFALESRLLLVSLHAGKRERKFDEATRHAERLVREHGTAVVALDAAGRAMLTMGRADQAAAWLDRAVAESKDRVHPSVAATLRLHRARCELARSRPDLALTWLEPLLARPATVPVSLRKDVAEAAAAARGAPEADLGRRPYRGVAPS